METGNFHNLGRSTPTLRAQSTPSQINWLLRHQTRSKRPAEISSMDRIVSRVIYLLLSVLLLSLVHRAMLL